MPKLPDIEYAVVTQGPPNATQAFGALAQGFSVMQDIQTKAMNAFAQEQAKAQMATASAVYESSLNPLETELDNTPYLSPAQIKSMVGDGVMPAHVSEAIQMAQKPGRDDTEAVIPTYLVAGAIHKEVAKRLAESVSSDIYSPNARSEFQRQITQDIIHRSTRMESKMAEQFAATIAAEKLASYEMRARVAGTDEQWNAIQRDIQADGSLSPVVKIRAKDKFADLQATQGLQREAASLAEEALGAGRDGITPWVDAGKATEAFEKSVVGKKPLVAEAARQKFTVSLEQNERPCGTRRMPIQLLGSRPAIRPRLWPEPHVGRLQGAVGPRQGTGRGKASREPQAHQGVGCCGPPLERGRTPARRR